MLDLSKRISLDFKFRCYGNQNQNDCLLLKTKGLLFKERVSQKQFETIQFLLLLQAISFFKEKLVIHSYYCEKTMFFCF